MIVIGLDLGTSALKACALDEQGHSIASCSSAYLCEHPQQGWSEQDPAVWFEACEIVLEMLVQRLERRAQEIAGIAIAGQMHGLVLLDRAGEPIRPALLWNDGRSAAESEQLNADLGADTIAGITGNMSYPGFSASKILWVKRHEPEHFSRIHTVLLPKDYLVYKLTGTLSSEYSDASGTLLMDIHTKTWSPLLVERVGLKLAQLPELHASTDVVGEVLPDIADRLGLPRQVSVATGCGDNAAAALGTMTVAPGQATLSLGTSGTICAPMHQAHIDPQHRVHTFCDAIGGYMMLPCILSAASANAWWSEQIIRSAAYDEREQRLRANGTNTVLFLPYLMGERSPHNDASARGVFFGLSLSTTQDEMTQAVYEGVAFAFKENMDICRSNGLLFDHIAVCGGGAKSRVWVQILANVVGEKIEVLESDEGPALGAALLALAACGKAHDIARSAQMLNRYAATVVPDAQAHQRYLHHFERYTKLYTQLRDLFGEACHA